MTESPLTPKEELEMRIYAFALYCEDRQGFATAVLRLSLLFGLMSGIALVAMASDSHIFSLLLGFTTLLLAGVALAFDMPGVARVHGDLRKRLMALGARVEAGGDLAAAEVEFNRTYDDCPLIFHAADAVALNAMQANRGRSKRLVVKRWQRAVRNVWRFDSGTFDW